MSISAETLQNEKKMLEAQRAILENEKLSLEIEKQRLELEKWNANREYIRGCAAYAVIPAYYFSIQPRLISHSGTRKRTSLVIAVRRL